MGRTRRSPTASVNPRAAPHRPAAAERRPRCPPAGPAARRRPPPSSVPPRCRSRAAPASFLLSLSPFFLPCLPAGAGQGISLQAGVQGKEGGRRQGGEKLKKASQRPAAALSPLLLISRSAFVIPTHGELLSAWLPPPCNNSKNFKPQPKSDLPPARPAGPEISSQIYMKQPLLMFPH